MSATDDALFGRFEPVARDAWRAVVERDLKGADFDRRLVTRTAEGLSIQPVYSADDAPAPSLAARATDRVRVVQRHAAADPETARAAIAADLAGGAHGITVRFDARIRTTNIDGAGLGVDGVAAPDARRLARTLESVDLATTPVRLEAGAASLAAAATLIAVADRQRVDRGALTGSLGIDPFATYASMDAVPGSCDDLMRHACSTASWVLEHAPGLRAIRLSTRPWHEAGAHAARDLAFTLAAGVSTLRSLARLGIAPADAARVIELEVAVGRDVFIELARVRALRATWARVLEASGAPDARADIRVHAETSWRTLTTRDPWVNALRTTHQTLAAIVGGADTVTVRPWDERLGAATALSLRLARNTALVLLEESHLDHVVDPGAGSAYIEAMTNEIAEQAWAELQELETAGGLWIALRNGEVARRVTADREVRDKRLRTRRDALTGTSEFADLDTSPIERAAVDLSALAARDVAERAAATAETTAALDAVEATRTTDPVGHFDAAIAAATAGATMLDISNRAYADAPVHGTELHRSPDAAPFEALRDAADAADTPPQAFAATWGTLPEYKARLGWTTNLLAAGGVRLEAHDNSTVHLDTPDTGDDVAAVAAAFSASGSRLAVLTASDARYGEIGADVVRALREAGAAEVWVAGRPSDALRDAGADRFVHLGVDVVEALEAAHRCIGVTA